MKPSTATLRTGETHWPTWLPSITNATFSAWWGAGLSTVLGVAKVWESWRDRFRVEIEGSFAGAAPARVIPSQRPLKFGAWNGGFRSIWRCCGWTTPRKA
jgi:hypothetical protein